MISNSFLFLGENDSGNSHLLGVIPGLRQWSLYSALLLYIVVGYGSSKLVFRMRCSYHLELVVTPHFFEILIGGKAPELSHV